MKKLMVEIDNRQEKFDSADIEIILRNCLGKTLEMQGIEFPVYVSVLLVDNDEIREINREYRGKDQSTDVLSFPMLELDIPCSEWKYEDLEGELDPETQAVVLGDIVISLEKAAQQAEEYGHDFSREVGFLTVHGALHLLGYDHEEKEDSTVMRQQEEAILGSLHLTRS